MATRTFTAAPAPRAAAPASRAPVQRAPAMSAPKASVGVPRFAAPRAAAPAAVATTSERISAPTARPSPFAIPPRQSPPASARHTTARHGEVDPRARVSRPESPFEREAGRFSTRVPHESSLARSPGARGTSAKLATRADSPAAGATPPSLAHPGLGPSPPSPDATSAQPLPPSVRVRLEAVTGFDLSMIRVVTGPGAERTAMAVQARAFTQHGRIHLGPTASISDATLLTHETAHALQQTLPAEQLARVGLSPAPADMVLRQPFSATPFTDRRLARRALFDPFGLPAFFMPDGVRRALHWVGDEGLGLRLTRAVPEALHPTLNLMRHLAGIWRIAQREADTFPARKEVWTEIATLSGATDDPSLITAAQGVANQLPGFLGPRWSHLQAVLSLTARGAELSGRHWEGGLTSLAPRVAAVLDDLAADIGGAFDEFSADSWVHDALRTALGCPRHINTSAAAVAWIGNLRQQADDWIQTLARHARRFTTAQFDTTTFTKLAALNPAATALGSDLRAVATIMATPEGLISERAKLTALLPAARQKIASLDHALAPPAQMLGYAFDGAGLILQSWGRAPVLDAFFPNEFTWMDQVGAAFDPWISQQEPQLLTIAQESFDGLDRWGGLLAETATEAETLERPVPDYDSGGFFNFFRKAWAWVRNKKRKIIEKLLKEVPLLRELMQAAPALWEKAKSLFGRFVERIFKEGKILAPLWEYFLGVLELALPSAAGFVRDIAQRAGSLLGKILKHPFQFLGNLVKGIGLGFANFGANIGNHLLNGLLDWLLGEFELSPPPTIGKVIGGLMDRIGFSRQKVSERIAEYLKSKNRPITPAKVDSLLVKAIDAGATALRWLKHLVRGEFTEFWQEIKHHLGKLWRWLVDRAVGYAVVKVKKLLPPKLAQFLDPTGIMMIFNVITTLYDAIQTVIRYAQQMFAIVREIFRAVSEIANGQIERAAQFVENAAANGLSVALGFLARFVGLDSVVDYLKAALGTIQRYVVEGIDALVRFTGDFWEWIYDKAEQASDWWHNRRRFIDHNGEPRVLAYDTKGQSAVLVIDEPHASGQARIQATPPTLGAYLAAFKPANAHEKSVHGELLNFAGQIDHIKKEAGGSFSAAKGDLINTLFNEIVILLGQLGSRVPPPQTKVTWDTKPIYDDHHGKKMVAEFLSTNPGEHIGSKPISTDTKLWSKVSGFYNGGDTHYIKGHLLNHHLHGPGIWKNMTPIARSTNTRMESIAEGPVKQAVIGQNRVVRYEIDMIYGQHRKTPKTEQEGKLPSRIEMSAEELTYKKGKWVRSGVKIFNEPPLENEIR